MDLLIQNVHINLHSTIFILKPLSFMISPFSSTRFTFYYIYIKTLSGNQITFYGNNLHSTIFILKLKYSFPFSYSSVFTFYYIYIKTRGLFVSTLLAIGFTFYYIYIKTKDKELKTFLIYIYILLYLY